METLAHAKTKKWIVSHLSIVAKAFISACGYLMGIDARFCGPSCCRRDEIVFMTEQTIRYPGTDLNRYGRTKTVHFRFDGVFFLCPGSWGLNEVPSRRKVMTIAVEIKENVRDLREDEKILSYLGWTDFFFLFVPADLKEEAVRKVNQLMDPRVGVLVYDSCRCLVDVVPQRQSADYENMYALALQAIFSNSNCAAHSIIEWGVNGGEEISNDYLSEDEKTEVIYAIAHSPQKRLIRDESKVGHKRVSPEEWFRQHPRFRYERKRSRKK